MTCEGVLFTHTSALLMYNLLAARSSGAALTTTSGTGAGAGVRTAISAGSASAATSPAAGFGFHGVPHNVVRN